jgi:hypothetical protein
VFVLELLSVRVMEIVSYGQQFHGPRENSEDTQAHSYWLTAIFRSRDPRLATRPGPYRRDLAQRPETVSGLAAGAPRM